MKVRMSAATAILAIAILAMVGAGSVQGVAIADREADWSSTQGQNGWYWMYELYDKNDAGRQTFDPARTELMTLFNSTYDRWDSPRRPDNGAAMLWGPQGAVIAQRGAMQAHTSQYNSYYWPVHRWVSSYAGNVTISGLVHEVNQGVPPEQHNNGEYVWIYNDGVRIQELPVYANDFFGAEYSVSTTVNVGSKIDFVLEPNGPGDLLPGEEPGWLMVYVSATIASQGSTIDCEIALPDFGGDLSLSPVRIETRQGGNVIRTDAVKLTANPGHFVINIDPGTYDLTFSANRCLRQTVSGVVVAVEEPDDVPTPVSVSLPNGDVDGDNTVGSQDVGIVTGDLDKQGE